MSGKTRPSQRIKVLIHVELSNLSYTDKQFVHDMFSLAEKQQVENERLNNELHSKVEYIHELLEIIESKKAEIKRLQYQVYRLKKYDEKRDIELHSRLIASSRIEAIKEFADRLKETISNSVYQYWNEGSGGYYLAEDVPDDIDNLVKEMVGDTE